MTARARTVAKQSHRGTPHVVREVLRTPGEALDPKAREWMEPRLGHDFRHVRVHRDNRAAEAAASIDAEAFAAGRHVVFGAGRYQPSVLAHELTHVTRQEPDVDALRVGDAHDPKEKAAERAVERMHGVAAPGAAPAGDGQPVIRRISRSDKIVGLTVVGGLLGGLIGNFTPLGIGLGALIGAAAGLVGGLLFIKRRKPYPRSGPLGTYLEVSRELDFQPTGGTALAQLPVGTRVIEHPAPEGSTPPAAGWIHIRVTTGPLLNVTGWVDKAGLIEKQNTTELSIDDANRLWQELSQATFLTEGGERLPIPFHYPPDGCFARAKTMYDILDDAGYQARKLFMLSRRRGGELGLRPRTPYGDEAPGEEPSVKWWYHVAPLVNVRDEKGTVQRMILDPSITKGPVTIDEWIALMNRDPGDFEEVTMEEFREDYGPGWTGSVFFEAPPAEYTPTGEPRPITPEQEMAIYAAEAQTRELVVELRALANAASATLAQVLATIARAPAYARKDLADTQNREGSETLKKLRQKFGEDGWKRIEAALGAD